MQQTIYLQAEDDLPAIRHLLEGAQARQVLLVVPKANETLHSTLNLRVLRRHAESLALDVALVSRDSRLRQRARDEGVPVVSSVRQGQRGRWRARDRAPADWRGSSAERAAARRVAGLRAGRGDVGYGDAVIVWAGRILGFLVFVTLLVVIVGLTALLVPQARIVVVPYRQPIEISLEVRADAEVERPSLEDRVIPARILEVQIEQTGQTSTLSKRDAPDAPATGQVTFINQTVAPQQILTDTIVRTTTGTTVRFKTVTTATLDAGVGARASVGIEALEPGPVGNVAAATINEIETPALRGKARVINEATTQGGGVKQVGVVTRADMDRLKAQLLEQLQQQAYVELQNQLNEQEFLPPESLTFEILTEVYDQFLDAEADVLGLQMRILASGTAVDQASANLLAFEALQEQVPDTYELESADVGFSHGEEIRMDGRTVIMDVTALAELVADVNRGAVRSSVAGLPVEEAVTELTGTFPLDAPPVVRVEPDWVKRWEWLDRVPYAPFRIQVLVLE